MRAGQLERRTHDYKRHGVTSLFAALDIATGSVLVKCYRRHRSVEFLDFLKKIDGAVPAYLDIHLCWIITEPTKQHWFVIDC